MAAFEEVKKKLGFGCMRLPMKGTEVDTEEMCRMVDLFLERGFNYFDTAHMYVGGKSESALKTCLTSRYPRDKYILTNKLSSPYFHKQEDIEPLINEQLSICGVEYFDFYLMHAQDERAYAKFQRCKAYETAYKFKESGKIKHFGISFHDKASVLEKIITEHPEIEAVQIQFNYADYEDQSVESRKCYDVCVKYGKPVIVMEPVRGGNLMKLPKAAQKVFDELRGGSNAEYAIRFAAGFDSIFMVLSGMSNMEQMLDNTSYMRDFKPLDEREMNAVAKVVGILKHQKTIPCTACRYCTDGCPKNIEIPAIFAALNAKKQFKDWNAGMYYHIHTTKNNKASDCIKCGKCEASCPQHLPIRKLLEDAAKEFEK